MPTVQQDGAAVPAAVVKQAAEDERAQQAEIAAQKAAAAAKVPEPTAEPAPEPTPTPQAPPVVQPQAPVAQPGLEQQVQNLQQQLVLERQRNQTLQGQMKSLGPQTAEIIRDLRAQVDELKQAVQSPPTPSVPPHELYLSAEERAAYQGEELPVETRMARGYADAVLGQVQEMHRSLSADIAALKEGNTQDREAQRRAVLMDEVEKRMPGARDINLSPAFDDWLSYPDHRSITGATYGERGAQAMARGDAAAVQELMQDFLASGLATDPRITAQIKPEATTVTPAVKPPVEKDMVPLSNINAFYNDVALGRAKNPDGSLMSEAQIQETQAKIDLAEREGRIVRDM